MKFNFIKYTIYLYGVFVIMRFWNLLGYIIGVPLVCLAGLTILYCIFYALGKVISGIGDIIKYPTYYINEICGWFKKHKSDIAMYIILYITVLIIFWFIKLIA